MFAFLIVFSVGVVDAGKAGIRTAVIVTRARARRRTDRFVSFASSFHLSLVVVFWPSLLDSSFSSFSPNYILLFFIVAYRVFSSLQQHATAPNTHWPHSNQKAAIS